jgi:hypothetical protein
MMKSPQAAAAQPTVTEVMQKPDMSQFYGNTSGKSNLKANQRQLATGSTAPNPGTASVKPSPHPQEIMDALSKPGEMSDADLALLRTYDFARRVWKTAPSQ